MPVIVIADTSYLILLQKIGQLELLSLLYAAVTVTPDVVREFCRQLPEWFLIQAPMNDARVAALLKLVDAGEASSIALAQELPDAYLILDDRRARNVAESLGLRITGTMGILLEAKRAGLLPRLKPVLQEIRATDFRLSTTLEAELLRRAGE